ncbi:MAG: hypothetical protein AAF357_04420, partial [Verrucomicrobiota bacterium]
SCIREARPDKLFIAVDGARPHQEGERALVEENRLFASRVDWSCQVETKFNTKNLGCGRAVSEAISWFFSEVDEGIILEDDCVPDSSFFDFAAEMLERYRSDDRIMMVNGTSYLRAPANSNSSYYFSRFDSVWGWATWRSAWDHYDFDLKRFPKDQSVENVIGEFSLLTRLHLKRIWRRIRRGKVDTWDYQWEHSIWANDGIVITPFQNLISNIGFDSRATHTSNPDKDRSDRAVSPLESPLNHPEQTIVSQDLDRKYERERIMSFRILFKLIVGKIFRWP